MIKLLHNQKLADFTSLGVGGPADDVVIIDNSYDLEKYLQFQDITTNYQVLGYGANSLIADCGLRGTTIILHGGEISYVDDLVIADSGVWWDDLVKDSISRQLFGLELMSGIPGSVGAAVFGNIAAYGQAVADCLHWVDVYDVLSNQKFRLSKTDLKFDYRSSEFQGQNRSKCVILKAAFKLSNKPTHELKYQGAINVANQLNLKPDNLQDRREIIMEARIQAGSLFDLDQNNEKTAGSFFRNPVVQSDILPVLAGFDEKNTLEAIIKQNQIHGGSTNRVSAALVMLAAGFYRGQTWRNVRLHPEHVLKIENIGSASAQEIFNVSKYIQLVVKQKLGIDLNPEVQFLGKFGDYHEPTN